MECRLILSGARNVNKYSGLLRELNYIFLIFGVVLFH